MFFSRSATPEVRSGVSTPSMSPPSTPSSPRLIMEKWIVDVEDLQDKLDAISIASSASSTSRSIIGSLYNGIVSSTDRLVQLANPFASFEWDFPSLEEAFPS